MKHITYTLGQEDLSCYYVTEDSFSAALNKLKLSNVYGLDIETLKTTDTPQAGLDPYQSNIRLVQIHDGVSTYVFDLNCADEDDSKSLKAFLSTHNFAAHYAIFELKHLKHNLSVIPNCHCTMLMGQLVHHAEESPDEADDYDGTVAYGMYSKRGSISLANMYGRYFGVHLPKDEQKSDWGKDQLTPSQIVYAACDAVATYRLAKKLMSEINTYKIGKAYKLFKDMQHVIVEMELNGIGIDREEHDKLIQAWQSLEQQLKIAANKYFEGVNMRSSKQVTSWVNRFYANDRITRNCWPVTRSGNYSFNKNDLAALSHLEPVRAILDYKKYATLLSTFGEGLQNKINPVTGRLHCRFSLGKTRTGRLSSSDPNLQNMPSRDESFRHIFTAKEGHKLVVADFSQIEIRVGGELSQDPVILGAFKNQEDLHKKIVAILSGKPIDHVTKEERQLGKAVNFGLMFGMGAKKLAFYAKSSYGVDMSEEHAHRAWEVYHSTYRVYSEWCRLQRLKCERIGYVRTPMGRMRRLTSNEVYTKSVNTPVQGGAAEVLFISMINLTKHLFGTDIKLLNTVHDEIVLEAPDEQVPLAQSVLVSSMQAGMRAIFPNSVVDGLVEANAGPNWALAK